MPDRDARDRRDLREFLDGALDARARALVLGELVCDGLVQVSPGDQAAMRRTIRELGGADHEPTREELACGWTLAFQRDPAALARAWSGVMERVVARPPPGFDHAAAPRLGRRR